MKVAKLVTGILSIILSVLVLLQSCAAGVSNALEENGEVGGSAGFFVAIGLLAAGIVSIATRGSSKKGGSIACVVIYFLAAILGFTGAGSYSDLIIWSVLCAACGILHIVSIAKSNNVE